MTIHNIAIRDLPGLASNAGRYPRRRMSQRMRVNLIAGGVAAIAVGAIVGATLVQSHRAGPGKVKLAAVSKPLRGYPPLFLDLGIRDDAETRALTSAVALYRKGKRAEAGATFARYDSLAA